MITLGIDTTAVAASVALVKDGKILSEFYTNVGLQHSRTLMPMIESMLSCCGIAPNQIDRFGVTVGPGSFTGLRIGMATAKGIVQGGNKKLIAIPTLDTLAQNLNHYPGIICPIMNAQKKQVYTAIYKSTETGMERLSDYQAIEAETLAEQLLALGETVWFTGDGVDAFADVFRAKLGAQCRLADGNTVLPRAGALAMLAAERAEQEQFDDLYQAELIYIRKSEAEVQWEARNQQTQA
jgi:tRNA threonylcarbamoyladenosine biosynthesis protein TsaB